MRPGLPAIAAVLVLASASFPAPAAEKADTGPRISVEPASFDFGRAQQNRKLQKEFSIRNFGDADLEIRDVSTTCGCTAALMDSTTVKPGGTTPLRVSLETRTYRGRLVRSVLVRSNDPERPVLELRVEVEVLARGAKPSR